MIYSALIGLLAGFLGGRIMQGRGFGFWGNLIVGIVGGIVGGFTLGAIGISTSGIIGDVIRGTLGAVVLLFIVGLIRKNSK